MRKVLVVVLVVQLYQTIAAAPATEGAEKNELVRSKREFYEPNLDCQDVERIRDLMVKYAGTLDNSNQGQLGEVTKLNDRLADLIKFLKTWHCNCHKKCQCCQGYGGYPSWRYPGWGNGGGYPGWGNGGGYPGWGNGGYPVGPEIAGEENLYSGMMFPDDYRCSCGRPNGCCLPTCNSRY